MEQSPFLCEHGPQKSPSCICCLQLPHVFLTKGEPNFLAPPSNLFSFNFRVSLFAASRAPSRHGSGQATAFFFAAQLEQTIHHSSRIEITNRKQLLKELDAVDL